MDVKLRGALSPVEAAEYISGSASSLAKWRMVGSGPVYVKLGKKKIVYRIKDLDTYLEDRVCKPIITTPD